MNLQKMMQQAQAMQQKMADAQAQVEALEVEGASGSGAVKLRLNGKRRLLAVSIDPSALADKEMLEDLLIVAHNDACDKLDNASATQMKSVTSGLNLPPGFKLPF